MSGSLSFCLVLNFVDVWSNHLEAVSRADILRAAQAPDQVERVAVKASAFEARVVDVNRYDFPDHKAAARWGS